MPDICGVLLAAGFSTRFGANKLLTDIDGQAMIVRSAAALAPCDRVVAVVRGDDAPVHAQLHTLGIETVVNPQPARGIGYSIACAVRATGDSDGWCILPADMPMVSATSTARVVRALRNGALLAAPLYQGRRGHPVGFAAPYFEPLAALDGDIGARRILDRNVDKLTTIATDDAGVVSDIDMPGQGMQSLK